VNSILQKSDYIKTLEAAIYAAHNVWPTHRGTFLVREETEENTVVWEGPVEFFALPGYEKAENCFAWQHTDADGNVKFLAVLDSAFIDSAQKAVQAAIVQDIQPALPTRVESLELFRKNLQERRSLLREAQIKTENLNAAIQSVKDTMERINYKRILQN
jgi:hypothetical protein